MSHFRSHDHYANQRMQPQKMTKPVKMEPANKAATPKTAKHPAAPNKQGNPKGK